MVLALRNSWVIILRQEEYKNLPIPLFYAFALIAVSLRTIFLIMRWEAFSVLRNIDYVQQAAKLCVGVVQDWITLELAIRIRNSKGYSNISEKAKIKLRFVRRVLFIVVAIIFTAYSFTIIVLASKNGNHGQAFYLLRHSCLFESVIGYLFLI